VYLTLKSEHLRELEALAIRIASPKENRQMGKLRKSQNLKKIGVDGIMVSMAKGETTKALTAELVKLSDEYISLTGR